MHPEPLHIALRTNDATLATSLRKTLHHLYPGLSIQVTRKEKNSEHHQHHLWVIDALACKNGRVEGLLESIADLPAILLVPTISDIAHVRHLLRSRLEILTHADVASTALISTVHHLLERQRLHEQLQKTAVRMKEMAIRDDATKLFNRHHFKELLEQEAKKAIRYRHPLGVILVGLRTIRPPHQTVNPADEDLLLKRCAQLLAKSVREVDVVARFGDDELAAFLPESDESATFRAAKRLERALIPLCAQGFEEGISAVTSIGIAALGSDLQTVEELLGSACEALREAKKGNASAIVTASDLTWTRRALHEDRGLIERLQRHLTAISEEVEKNYFTALLKTFAEEVAHSQLLVTHSERVAFFAEKLAHKLGLSNGQCRLVRRAGLLHDAGKLAIAPEIIAKEGPLSPAEFELIQRHPQFGVEILHDAPFLTKEIEAIRHHHERFDGYGYPEGLSGERIPMISRILSIAEAWEVMTSPQPYRPTPLTLDAALAELKKGSGSQFDPRFVAEFTALITG